MFEEERTMGIKQRIQYALSIKHWCNRYPKATDEDLVHFLEKIEKVINKEMDNEFPFNVKNGIVIH